MIIGTTWASGVASPLTVSLRTAVRTLKEMFAATPLGLVLHAAGGVAPRACAQVVREQQA